MKPTQHFHSAPMTSLKANSSIVKIVYLIMLVMIFLSNALFAQQDAPPQISAGSSLASGSPSPNLSNLDRAFFSALAEAARKAAEHTRKVGAPTGGEFEEMYPGGGLLVGFDVWYGSYGPHLVIRGLRPIFETANGRIRGSSHGRTNGKPKVVVEAKDGYAVAAIEARGGDRLDGFRILFWKVRRSDIRMEAEASYESDWIGGHGGGKAHHPLGSEGRPVLGIYGGSGDDVDRLGLIYADQR